MRDSEAEIQGGDRGADLMARLRKLRELIQERCGQVDALAWLEASREDRARALAAFTGKPRRKHKR